MENIFLHHQASALAKRESISIKLVAATTVLVGLLLIGFSVLSGDVANALVFVLTYYCCFWFFPAGYYIHGVDERKQGKLLWWIFSVSFSIVGMVICCVVILNDYFKNPYNGFDSYCIAAVVLLCLLPVFFIPLLLPSLVYINMRKDLPSVIISTRSSNRPLRAVTSPRPAAPASRLPVITERRTSSSRNSAGNERDEPSMLEVAGNHCNSVMQGSFSMMTGVLDNIRSSGAISFNRETAEDREDNDDDVESHANQEPLSANDDPPSYRDAEDLSLPSYEDLGAKRIQIGENVLVVDKDFQISAFKDVQNV